MIRPRLARPQISALAIFDHVPMQNVSGGGLGGRAPHPHRDTRAVAGRNREPIRHTYCAVTVRVLVRADRAGQHRCTSAHVQPAADSNQSADPFARKAMSDWMDLRRSRRSGSSSAASCPWTWPTSLAVFSAATREQAPRSTFVEIAGTRK